MSDQIIWLVALGWCGLGVAAVLVAGMYAVDVVLNNLRIRRWEKETHDGQ